jgi:putative transposase
MFSYAEMAGIPLDGADGLINQPTKAVIERALRAELDDHLGYVKGDLARNGSGNSHNGSYGNPVTAPAGISRTSRRR